MSAPPVVNPQNAIADASPARGQDRHILNPPAAQYVRVDDKLIIDSISGVNIQSVLVSYRLLDTSGQIIEFTNSFVLLGDFAPHTISVNLNEGFLLGVTVQAAAGSALLRGATFVAVSIGRLIAPSTFLRGMCIISDYLSTIGLLAWPGGSIRQASDGSGWLKTFTIGNPAAGADWSFAVPTNVRLRLRAIAATFTTAVAVANRQPVLRVRAGATTLFRAANSNNHTASLGLNYTWAAGVSAPVVGILDVGLPMPPDFEIPAGATLDVNTTNLQAADQWTGITMLYEEYKDL